MELKDIPMGEVQHDVAQPGVKKAFNGPIWARYFKTMKVDSCVRVASKKEADAMKAYFRARHVPTTQRQVGDGTFVVWRGRKQPKQRKVSEPFNEVFPAQSLFDND